MAKLLKLRRGTTSQHSSFTGAEGEVTVDTDKETLVVHNGSTAGGFPVMSASGGTFTGAVTFNAGVNYQGDLDLQDNDKLLIGTGDDLQIYHDASHSYLNHTGTGHLYMYGNGVNDIYIRAKSDEESIIAKTNGAVELYYDNSKRFHTTSSGAQLSGHLFMDDDNKVQLGSSQDLQIWHSGSFGRILNANDDLYVDAINHFIRSDGGNDNAVVCRQNGAVELYHNNSKKFETSSSGADVTGRLYVSDYIQAAGHILLADSKKAQFGAGYDLQIFHNGTDSFIQNDTGHLYIHQNDATKDIYFLAKTFAFNNEANTENMITATTDGAVKLFYDGAQKIQTKSTGVYIQGSMGIELENSYFIYPNNSAILYIRSGSSSSNSIALQTNGTTRGWINCNSSNEVGFLDSDGAWAIQHIRDDATNFKINNTQKAQINANGLNVSGLLSFNGGAGHYITMADGQKIGIGSSNDMNLRHESGNTYIENNTGTLYIRPKSGENGVTLFPDGAVKLAYDDNTKFETASTGPHITTNHDIRFANGTWTGDAYGKIQQHDNWMYFCIGSNGLIFRTGGGTNRWSINSSGHFYPQTNNTYDIGNSSNRVRNLYVNDAHFSNEGSSNSVDGTWGDWTLQEGEDDIFMLNNRSGKKYRMALTEVS